MGAFQFLVKKELPDIDYHQTEAAIVSRPRSHTPQPGQNKADFQPSCPGSGLRVSCAAGIVK